MKKSRKIPLATTFTLAMLTGGTSFAQGAGAATNDALATLLEASCLSCHQPPRPKGRVDLKALLSVEPDSIDLRTLRSLRNVLVHGDMPPEGEPRPDPAHLAAAVIMLDDLIRARAAAPIDGPVDPGRVVMRRLNRVEYANTIRDLLGVDFDAARFLPADEVGHGFDVIGDVLTMPPLLLEKYFDAAERIASEAFPDPLPETPQVRRVPAGELRVDGRGASLRGGVQHLSTNATVIARHDFPVNGLYRITIEAAGQQAGPEPVKIALQVDGRAVRTFDVPNPLEAPGAFTAEVVVNAGARRLGAAFTNDYYKADDPDPRNRDRNAAIIAISIEGPLDAGVGGAAQRAAANRDALRQRDPERWVRDTVARLATSAFRRPVSQADVKDLLDVAGTEGTPESRVRTAVTAMLVSPRFLYRPEPSSGRPRDLDGYELATRLSYFLWSSGPDEELLRAAGSGELNSPQGLERHATRLLADPRSIALAENFATQWLQIRDLPQRSPDPARFPGVDASLLSAMQAETILLFDAVLRENRNVRDLLACDFTFLNERLARHYGIPGVRGEHMRRVRLPRGMTGGVIAHAGVLTATSNPTRTSPVKRGKWVLEALLDDAPPPPPPGADSFEAARDKTQARTVREVLAQHRADPNCSVCHRRMDALGFALEHFDPVGRYRATDSGLPVDSLGELPDGRTLRGMDDLQKLLLTDQAYLRSLARHLLTYALGRGVMDADEPLVARLVEALEQEPTVASLVRAIVRSDAFRRGGGERSGG